MSVKPHQETRPALHLSAAAGQYANLSVFAVDGNEQLHSILWRLPLFPHMTISVVPLAGHPSDIALASPDDS